MAGKLSVMMGPPGSIFMDPTGKSDFDAGLLALYAATRLNPGLRWSDFQRPQRMAGWWTDLKKAAGDVKDGIGDVISDTVDMVARKGGDTVRLATDDSVAGTLSRVASAIATGGASEAAGGISEAIGKILSPQGQAAVEAAGSSYKSGWGLSWKSPWVMIPAAGVGVLGFIWIARKAMGR